VQKSDAEALELGVILLAVDPVVDAFESAVLSSSATMPSSSAGRPRSAAIARGWRSVVLKPVLRSYATSTYETSIALFP
jgi:hypothetical protein